MMENPILVASLLNAFLGVVLLFVTGVLMDLPVWRKKRKDKLNK